LKDFDRKVRKGDAKYAENGFGCPVKGCAYEFAALSGVAETTRAHWKLGFTDNE